MDEEAPLVVKNLESQIHGKSYTRDVHILSTAFLLIFSAYGAAQNLQTTLNTEGDIGTISLGILYTSFMVFSLVASLVVRFLGTKNAILLGTTGYWLYIVANLKPTWYTMVPAALYMGFSASIIWVAEGTHLTSIARSHARDNNLHEGTVIGSFNGEFWGMFAGHQIIGNVIALFLLSDSTEDESTGGTTLLFILFLVTITVGCILMCFLHKRDSKEEEGSADSSVGFLSSLVSLWKSIVTLLTDIRMLLIIPLIAYSGLQQAFVWSTFTKYIVKPAIGESGVGGAMAVYGAFDAICSLIVGRLTSGLKSITVIVSTGAFIQLVVLLWLLLKYSVTIGGVFGTLNPLIVAAAWGIGDGVLNTQLSALLGMLFKRDMEGAFAQLKLWQSAAIAVVFFISPYITLQVMLVIMLVAICIASAAFLLLTLYFERVFSHVA